MELSSIDNIVDKHEYRPWAMISVLQDIQKEVGYLPNDVLRRVAEKMDIPLTQIYGVATFYKSLNLMPQGRHTVTLCMGTACHVRGSNKLLDEVSKFLGVGADQTTKDGEYTLKVANCLGACAIGPVIVIDGQYYAKMTASKAKELLSKQRS